MTSPLLDGILEAWRTHHRIHLYLLERIDDEGLRSTLSTRGGRDVARQFAHLHDVRVWHIERRKKGLAEGLKPFASKRSPGREELVRALNASAEAVGRYLAAILAGEVRGPKKGPIAALGYFISHESHHRGSILLTLKMTGHKLDDEAAYGIWDWDRR